MSLWQVIGLTGLWASRLLKNKPESMGRVSLCFHYARSICRVPSVQVHGTQKGRTQSCCPQEAEGTRLIHAAGKSWASTGCRQVFTRTSLVKALLSSPWQ